MAVGDQGDFLTRLLNQMPKGWFPPGAPRVASILAGLAALFAAAFAMLGCAKAQMRVSTATGGFIDLAARDFFGPRVKRLQFELDDPYRARIKFNLTAPRGTWDGMVQMLTQLTGNAPDIFKPVRPDQTGALGSRARPAAGGGTLSLGSRASPGSGSGRLGTMLRPGQVFITVYRPVTGLAVYAYSAGLGSRANPAGGLGAGLGSRASPAAGIVTSNGNASALQLVNPNSLPGEITDAFIYAQIADWMPAGFVAWVNITNKG